MAEAEPSADNTSYGAEHEFRIALIGRTGSGKSATGNHILGKEVFPSKLSGSSVTKKCQFHTAERFGKKLVVVDTPGLFDTKLSNADTNKEIIKCIGILNPGPHAFILVTQVGRFTPEESDTVTNFSLIFGEEFYKYLVVIFTRADDLQNNGTTIQQYVEEVPDTLQLILQRCGHKYLGFDNSPKGQKNEYDVLELIRMVQAIKNETGMAYFSDPKLEKVELEFQRRARQIRDKGEKDILKIREEMNAQRREIEKQKEEFDAKLKLQAKEMEMQKKEMENAEKHAELLRKQEAEKTEMEEKMRELERKNAEFELKKKRELEEQERQHEERIRNMRDNERKRIENEDKSLLDGLKSVASTVGKTVYSWFFG